MLIAHQPQVIRKRFSLLNVGSFFVIFFGMPYSAYIYRVFVASPSDVPKERNIIRKVIGEWNAINGSTRKIYLDAIAWETHAVPEMGAHPQTLLNKQLLKNSDLLIAVFWTRLGTATASYASGTVEEIEEHLGAGKPAMIYFSDAPISPAAIDPLQYRAVRDFRKTLESKGLIEQYSNLPEFNQKLARQLHVKLNFPPKLELSNGMFTEVPTLESDAPYFSDSEVLMLSDDALYLLTSAATGQGLISKTQNYFECRIRVGSEWAVDTSTPVLRKKWEDAVQELCRVEFIAPIDGLDEDFEVTNAGYEFCDAL